MLPESNLEVSGNEVVGGFISEEYFSNARVIPDAPNLPFKIMVAEDAVSSGVIKLTWCVGVETIEHLSDRGVIDPQIVIIISPHGDKYSSRKEQRYVVPMKDLMAFVEINSAGKNNIRAFISKDKKSYTKDTYLVKCGGRYATDVLSCDGKNWSYIFTEYKDGVHPMMWSELTVDVPQECFAPEPPQWEKVWVNWLLDTPCDNQCEYRRRRIFAYTIQIPLFAIVMFWRIFVTLIAFLYLSRGLTLKHVLHPMTYPAEELSELFKGSYLSLKCKEDEGYFTIDTPTSTRIKYVLKKACLLPFMPISIIIVSVTLYFGVFLKALLIVLGIIAVMFIALLILSGALKTLAIDLWAWINDEDRSDGKMWYLDKEEIDNLSCSDGLKFKSVNDLPSKHRTIRLRFLDLKSKVCRPFSKE